VQQKIRRAERDGLRYESGRSEALLNHFYRLLVRTRRRHRVPPQPYRWYQNLISSMANRITLHIAFDQNQPAAAIVTLRHQKTLTCKYSCSDERLNSLGGIPFLFWQVIQEAKGSGMETVDLGRSDMNNPGLITFKERLGAMPSSLIYWTHSRHTQRKTRRNGLAHMAQRITPRSSQFIHYLPDSLLELSGRMLYKHLD
jgi:lipid II:glycine glycyltransferase (peptidoglycan interpeptide bridge formation enzyme)